MFISPTLLNERYLVNPSPFKFFEVGGKFFRSSNSRSFDIRRYLLLNCRSTLHFYFILLKFFPNIGSTRFVNPKNIVMPKTVTEELKSFFHSLDCFIMILVTSKGSYHGNIRIYGMSNGNTFFF